MRAGRRVEEKCHNDFYAAFMEAAKRVLSPSENLGDQLVSHAVAVRPAGLESCSGRLVKIKSKLD